MQFWNESGEVARVARYEMHPAYKNGDNDFAILKLDTPIAESSTIGYAQLPAEDQADPEAGTIATVAGW
jgi:trypsin